MKVRPAKKNQLSAVGSEFEDGVKSIVADLGIEQ